MSQLKLIENAIKTSSLPIDGIGKLPSNHLELILAFSYKHNNLECFEKAINSISFNSSSIKTKSNLLNWLISHNINDNKNLTSILENKCIQFCLHNGIRFDLSIINKTLKEVNLYKVFPYCDNINPTDFNSIFVKPIINKEYKELYQRIYDTLDYHKKYNRDIPLKFFENICKIIIPNCVIAEIKYSNNPDLQECKFAIQEFIEYFSDNFDFFQNIPKESFLNMTKIYFPNISIPHCEKYYNSMRENILNKKLASIEKVNTSTHKSKKI